MGKDDAILDIGSGKLIFTAGHKTAGGIFYVDSFAEAEYAGYYDGAFVDPDGLGQAVASVVEAAGYKGRRRSLCVGLPAAFTKIECFSVMRRFPKERVVSQTLIDELFENDYIFSEDEYGLADASAVSFLLNGNYETLSPLGERAGVIQANIAYTLCDKRVLRMLASVASASGFENTEFCFASGAAAKMLPREHLEKGAVLVDAGFSALDYVYVYGSACVSCDSAQCGGAQIADDLAYCMGIPFDDAYAFCRRINLMSEEENYSVRSDGETLRFATADVHAVVRARLDEMAAFIKKKLAEDVPLPKTAPIFLTGGGLSGIRGAQKYLGDAVGRNLLTLVADVPGYDKPEYTRAMGILEYLHERRRAGGLLRRLFG